MSNTVYVINRGINRSITFRGLKAQYIIWLALGLVLLLLLFAILHILGVNTYVCIGLVLLLGTGLIGLVYRLSKKYGKYGLMKEMAGRKVPRALRSSSRKMFMCKQA